MFKEHGKPSGDTQRVWQDVDDIAYEDIEFFEEEVLSHKGGRRTLDQEYGEKLRTFVTDYRVDRPTRMWGQPSFAIHRRSVWGAPPPHCSSGISSQDSCQCFRYPEILVWTEGR